MSSFTPGPWVADENTVRAGGVNLLTTTFGNVGIEVCVANAKLCAAAPDLFSVVEAAVAAWGSLETSSLKLWEANLLVVARAALAKARGE